MLDIRLLTAGFMFTVILISAISTAHPVDTIVEVESGEASIKENTNAAQNMSKYTGLEAQIDEVKRLNQDLVVQEQQLKQKIERIQENLGALQKWIFLLGGGQTLLNPTRFISPALGNLTFFFGALALLILVLGWPVVARKLLSVNYPFSLPVSRRNGDETSPMSETAKIIWVVIFVLVLIFMALPAVSQIESSLEVAGTIDAEAENPSGEEGDVKEGVTGVDYEAAGESDPVSQTPLQPSSMIEQEINQAIDFIQFSALERALYAIDNLSEGEKIRLTFEPDLLRLLNDAAKKHRHPPIVSAPDPPSSAIIEEVRKESLGYYFIKASLYEAAGRDGVRKLLEEGAAPLIENKGAALVQLNMQALMAIMLFLAAYQSGDYVEVMIPIAMDKASHLNEVVKILEVAHALDLPEAYSKAIEASFGRQQPYDAVESVFNLAMKHGRAGDADFIVTAAIKQPYSSLNENLKVVQLLNRIGDTDRVVRQLDTLSDNKRAGQLMEIAAIADNLGLTEQCISLSLKAVSIANEREDFQRIIDASEKHGLFQEILVPIAERLKSDSRRMLYTRPVSWPSGFDAALYDEEDVSLGVWIATHLYLGDHGSVLARDLLETTISLQLREIVVSLGTRPLLALNDLYGLVYYYAETQTDGIGTAMNMLALQRTLRGLSDESEIEYEDSRLLALQMELDQQTMRQKRLEESVAALKEERSAISQRKAEATWKFLALLGEISAKGLLVLLAIWIAFARAVVAAKMGRSFRFSHFCLTFTETVGFECCCTIILVIPGTFITLISQDRLKHLHITEYAPPGIPELSREPHASASTDASESGVARHETLEST